MLMDELELKKRVSERTGLIDDKELSAYLHFCKHADLKDGVILLGDVRYEFYREIAEHLTAKQKEKIKFFLE